MRQLTSGSRHNSRLKSNLYLTNYQNVACLMHTRLIAEEERTCDFLHPPFLQKKKTGTGEQVGVGLSLSFLLLNTLLPVVHLIRAIAIAQPGGGIGEESEEL